MASGRPHVAVVGAGIVGASVAFRLAARGARVTVVEQEAIGAGATGSSFAWANAAATKRPRAYWELHRASLEAWGELAHELGPPLGVRLGGAVEWLPPGAAASSLRDAVYEQQVWGWDGREVSEEELRLVVPGLEPGPVGIAVHAPAEAAVDPVAAASRLLAASGAELRVPCMVSALAPGRLLTDAGELRCDRIVLACGVGTGALAGAVGIPVPLVESLGALAHTAPVELALGPVLLAPGVHLLQRADGRVVIGSDFGSLPAASVRATAAATLLDAAARYLPMLEHATLERQTIGARVLPADGLPIVGPGPEAEVYVAALHSGVSLAPIVGELVAAEVLGELAPELQPYRPARFGSPSI